MDKYLTNYRVWYQGRNLREKLLVITLSWALIYAIFSILFFHSIDAASEQNTKDLKTTNDQIKNWQTQLKFLADIPKTALYKEWVSEHNNYQALKDKYKNLLGKPGSNKWDDIIKTILSNYPNITIEKIENLPESAYETGKIQSTPDSIYQQQMRLSVLGNFQDIVAYLSSLEAAMPTIHWDTLNYTVTTYPIARVEMEFSILYEKTKS